MGGQPLILTVLKNSVKYATDILNNHGTRLNLFDNSQRGRKEITLVELPQLLTGLREWRAREPCRHYINPPAKGPCVEGVQILLDDIPFGAVETERLARMRIEFHQANVGETGLLKTESLAASTRT